MYRKFPQKARLRYTFAIVRINRYLAQAGIASRRHADELIKLGRVILNDKVVRELGIRIDPTADNLKVDGKVVELTDQTVIYLLNKPRGVITTVDDPQGRPTVLDFVPAHPRVFPCGRLDEETMGLVLLTNDGTLCYQLTHPKFEHQKKYHVVGVSRNPEISWKKLQNAPRLKDGSVDIDGLILQKVHGDKIDFIITIHDGRNHIVRRLCAEVGIEVKQLTRLRIGKYELGNLAPGKYQQI